jgi:hypothetical protein
MDALNVTDFERANVGKWMRDAARKSVAIGVLRCFVEGQMGFLLMRLASGMEAGWRRRRCGSVHDSPAPKADAQGSLAMMSQSIGAFAQEYQIAAAHYGMRSAHNLGQRVAKIEATLQQLANVMVPTARQDERLIAIERRAVRRLCAGLRRRRRWRR